MDKEQIIAELKFKATRSGGPGGQHVNKVSSKVVLNFNLSFSKAFSEKERKRLLVTLRHRLTKENTLILQCDEARSQHKNKELALKRLFRLLKKGLEVSKKRIPTKPSKAVVEKRLKSKKNNAVKKAARKKPSLD
ncbi:MAG: alternative ribosome rescue aminoacyl-tRNA hydrolase ArfB [Bacteroidota bacterium]